MTLRHALLGCVVVFALAPPATGQTASLGYNFEGSNSTQSGFIPPDTNGAVGPNHVVVQANGISQMFNKSGTLASGTSQSLFSFWVTRAGQTGTIDEFDPRVVYDRASGRWFASANDSSNGNSATLIAVSPGTDPTVNGWFGTRFDMDSTGTRWADYNQLAVGPTWVTVTNNMFPVNTGSQLVSLITIPKANLLAGNATGLSYKENLDPNAYGFTPHTTTDYYSSNTTTQYTLARYGGTTLQLSTISGTTTNPSYTDFVALITVPSNTTPPNAAQSGTATLVDTGDTRISAQPVLVNGKLWAVHTSGSGSFSAIRWYRINPVSNTLEASGTLPGTGSLFVYYPAIAVNQAGDIVVGYSGSSSATFPSTYYTVGRFDGTTTTFGNPVLTQAGTGAITNGRFGDYSSTNIDPTDPGVFWTFQEYGSASSVWRTRATEVIPTRTGEIRWQTAAAAAVSTGAAWYNGTAPASTDHAIFSRWSTASYAVDATGGAMYDRLSVRQTGTGTVTFNIPTGSTLSATNTSAATPSFAVSEFQGTSNVTISGGGTLSTRHTIIAAEAGGAANVTVSGAGTTWNNANDLNLGGTATVAGGTGVLNVLSGAAVNVGGTLRIYKNDATAVQVAVGAAGAAANLSVAGLTAAAGTPRIELANAASVLAITDGASTTFAGTVTGTGSLAKQGIGTFTLTGNNTYSGGTIVAGGVLFVNGQTGTNSGTGTGTVAVTGGALRGTGRVGGAVTATSGQIAPGVVAAPGTLTVAAATTLTSAATVVARLNGTTAGTTHDQLVVESGNVDLGSAALTLSLGYTPGASDVLVILSNAGAGTTTGQFAGFPQGTGVLLGAITAYVVYDFNLGVGPGGGNDVAVVFTAPVPEPGVVLGVAALALGFGRRFRRR